MIDIRYMYTMLDTDGVHDLNVHWTLTLTDTTHTGYIHIYTDCDRHLWIPDCAHTLLCAIHITVYLLYSCHFLLQYIYFLYLLTCYMHMHFPVYSYTFTRSSDSLDLYIQIYGYLMLIRYLEKIICTLRNWSPSLLDYRYSCPFVHVISWFYLYCIQLPFLYYIHCKSSRGGWKGDRYTK